MGQWLSSGHQGVKTGSAPITIGSNRKRWFIFKLIQMSATSEDRRRERLELNCTAHSLSYALSLKHNAGDRSFDSDKSRFLVVSESCSHTGRVIMAPLHTITEFMHADFQLSESSRQCSNVTINRRLSLRRTRVTDNPGASSRLESFAKETCSTS